MAMSALGKKLVRDMRRSGMQFFAIVMLCSLGTFMFAGLDGTARLAQGTIDTYFAPVSYTHLDVYKRQVDGYPLYAEAANEKGLCIAGLNFPGNAFYSCLLYTSRCV